MEELVVWPPVTEELLQEVVRSILSVGTPEQIILFGSRARGDARPDSDIDLVIIEESNLPRYERSPRYYAVLSRVYPSKDILVYTPAEVDEWRAVPNALTTVALREGRVLYARPR